MKHFISIFLFFSAGLIFSSCKNRNPAAAPESADGGKTVQTVLFMSEENPSNSISGLMDRAFQKKVEELSQGKLTINVQYNGILGENREILNEMSRGKSLIDIIRISADELVALGCEKNAILTMPYVFSSTEHFWHFANSSLATEFLNEPLEKGLGLKGLFFGEENFINFFSNKPILSPGDLDSNTSEAVLVEYLEKKLYETAPNMILDKHKLSVNEIVIYSDSWNLLSQNQREILVQAGKYAGEYCKLVSAELSKDAQKNLLEKGIPVATVSDFEPWKKMYETYVLERTKDYRDLYERILNMAE